MALDVTSRVRVALSSSIGLSLASLPWRRPADRLLKFLAKLMLSLGSAPKSSRMLKGDRGRLASAL